jgi:hypothetical protein
MKSVACATEECVRRQHGQSHTGGVRGAPGAGMGLPTRTLGRARVQTSALALTAIYARRARVPTGLLTGSTRNCPTAGSRPRLVPACRSGAAQSRLARYAESSKRNCPDHPLRLRSQVTAYREVTKCTKVFTNSKILCPSCHLRAFVKSRYLATACRENRLRGVLELARLFACRAFASAERQRGADVAVTARERHTCALRPGTGQRQCAADGRG